MDDKWVVFDLDGTLALADHRLHHIRKPQKDWDAFFAECGKDALNVPIADICRALYRDGAMIAIWTGRSNVTRNATESWLSEHAIPYNLLRMRLANDRTPDHDLKESWLRSTRPSMRPVLVFEDRTRVVEMWRRNGISCCQVANGDF